MRPYLTPLLLIFYIKIILSWHDRTNTPFPMNMLTSLLINLWKPKVHHSSEKRLRKGKFPFEDRASNSAQKKQTVDFHTRVDVIKNIKQCKTIWYREDGKNFPHWNFFFYLFLWGAHKPTSLILFLNFKYTTSITQAFT